MNEQPTHGLVRAIGRWSLAALMLNTVLGASIFGLPSLLASHLGRSSPWGYLIAGAGIAVIAACLSEVASQFSEAGGPYLYAREAFGRAVAIPIGWLTWLSRVGATAAAANLFITYLSQFFPRISRVGPRILVLGALIGLLAYVNYRGVGAGSRVSNLFTATKVFLLVAFIGGGLAAYVLRPGLRVAPAALHPAAGDWFEAVLLLVYAFGGFEAALFVMGEARNPRKDAPATLLIVLTTVTVLYMAVQLVVNYTLPGAAASVRPLADAAKQFMGSAGGSVIAAGTCVSIYGYLSANMLHTPRLTFALGERGDFPAFFAAVHPRFRTPYVSILVYTALVLAFSVGGNFRWNASLSAVARLFTYASAAAALPVLRRKRPGADAFRLPAAPVFVTLALAFNAVLLTRMHRSDLIVVALTFVVAGINWLWVRARDRTAA